MQGVSRNELARKNCGADESPGQPDSHDSLGMADFYDRMQATATRLLGKYNQDKGGTEPIKIRRTATANVVNPWNPMVLSAADQDLKATVEPVAKKYIDGKNITKDDRMVIFNVISGFSPDINDQILIGSKLFEIKKLECYPDAGTPVYYEAVISA